MSRNLYDHPALRCEFCGPNTDGWHTVHHGDRAGLLWPHRKPREGEPADGHLVECDRCLAHQRHTLRQWDIFLQKWLSQVPDPRVVRPMGLGRRSQDANDGALLQRAGTAPPLPSRKATAPARRRTVTSSSRGQGTRP